GAAEQDVGVGTAGVVRAVAGARPDPPGDGHGGRAGGAGADAAVVQEQPGDAQGLDDGEDAAGVAEALRGAAAEGGGEGTAGEAGAQLPAGEEGRPAEVADEEARDARAGATVQAVC